MADSNSTKLELASALKTQTKKSSLEKISVTDICKLCGVNRKSFYYHFQDKYALVNWIFDTEFGAIASGNDNNDGLRALLRLLEYLYENRTFYRRAMQVKGQNSFTEHFRGLLVSSVKSRLCGIFNTESLDFRINFYADAFLCTIERWLVGRDSMPPGKLFGMICSCLSDSSEMREAIGEN